MANNKNTDDTEIISDAELEELDKDTATKSTYVHRFSEPFEWMGKTHETLTFDFGKLRGKDALTIYRELSMRGIMVISGRTSQEYQIRLASRACGLGVDAFEEMSFRDFEIIISKTRNFIPSAALL